MSIVDDTHTVGHNGRDERLWRTAAPSPLTVVPTGAPAGPRARRATEPQVFDPAARGEDLWKSRIDLVLSAGLSGDAARSARHNALRAQAEASFDAFRTQCHGELRPVLESSAAMLREWGLEARVTETLRDQPARVPRSFDLALWLDRFGGRGPGRLTITATEACEFVRVKLKVGPTTTGGEVSEHVGTTIARDLSDALVGGLVATLVEQIFSE
ncbi:MAG TPA: hypothetical protein VMV22_12920 [Acidimicrobiales bacterium]|nr:hypothetical protein [Acidimicrobiales bacterium]